MKYTVTDLLCRPVAHWLIRFERLHRRNKFRATLISVGSFWCFSLLSVLLLWDQRVLLAGATCLVGWQVAYVFDCLDGGIARRYGKGSSAGVGVDATADVLAMVSVTGAVVYAALFSGLSDPGVTLLAMSATARASGPLWTVADRLAIAGEPGTQVGGARAPKTLKAGLMVVRAMNDYPVTLLLLAIGVALNSAAFWMWVCSWLVFTSLSLAIVGFLASARRDGFS